MTVLVGEKGRNNVNMPVKASWNFSRILGTIQSMVSHRGHNCISSALTILDSVLTS